MASDSEDDDEDYNPQEDVEMANSEDERLNLEEAEGSTPLSSLQVKSVDEAFERLFGYKWGTVFRFTDSRKLVSHEKILCQMLGAHGAARILRATSGIAKGRRGKSVHKKHNTAKHLIRTERKAEDFPLSESSTVMPVTSRSNQPESNSGGVGKLLQTLSSSGKISTVAKTSGDWDSFKEKSGLGDKLEEQAESNTAFLKRQDFLDRVDHRKFEIEKQERERERVLRK